MTDLNAMWDALAKYQPYADQDGHGETWRKMCEQRTEKAAATAAAAAAAYAGSAAYATAWAAAWAAKAGSAAAASWSELAIKRIKQAIKEPVPSNIEPTSNDDGQAQIVDAQHSEIEQLKAHAVNMNPSLMAHSMTLRDWFAGQALMGLLACGDAHNKNNSAVTAAASYQMADAMLKAREVKP